MNYCFLFAKHLNNEGCFCLKLSSDGSILLPVDHYTFNQIKELQTNCITIVVETTLNASMFNVELPWLAEKKARIAIPYALEDKVAQPLTDLHFAFDKLRYQNNHYLVVVLSKSRMLNIIHILQEHKIEFKILTLDWFALALQDICLHDSSLIVHQNDFKGAFTGALKDFYLKKFSLSNNFDVTTSCLIARDPKEQTQTTEILEQSNNSYFWIAKNLITTKPMNLCQGALNNNKNDTWFRQGYKLAVGLCLFWLISILIVNGIALHAINIKLKNVDANIATIYHQFFPEAKQIINPRFRIQQLLNTTATNNKSYFWYTLDLLAKEIGSYKIIIERLQYQNKTLTINLISPDFNSLESIEDKIKSANLHVKRLNAISKEQKVFATLEIT